MCLLLIPSFTQGERLGTKQHPNQHPHGSFHVVRYVADLSLLSFGTFIFNGSSALNGDNGILLKKLLVLKSQEHM